MAANGRARGDWHKCMGLSCQRLIGACLFGGVLVSSPVLAQVSLPNGTLDQSSVELRVKVVGGSVDLTRRYADGRWQVNPHWSALKFELDPLDQSVKSIERNGSRHELRGEAWIFDAQNVIRAQPVLILTPTAAEGTAPANLGSTTPEATLAGGLGTTAAPGYRWSDRRGNWVDYDGQGRIVSYGDQHDVRVWFQYGAGGLERIRDHFGRTVLSVSGATWTDSPGFYGASGGSPRSVTVGAGGNFTDILGHTTQITYALVAVGYTITYEDGREVSRSIVYESRPTVLTDPEGHTRNVSFGPTGRISSLTHADGSVTSYGYDYDKLKREFYVRATTKAPAGVSAPDRVEETWYDENGQTIRRDVNGQTLTRTRQLDTRTRETTDARGLKTTVTTDEFDNVVKTVYPDGAQTTAKYDPVYTNVLEETDELGVKTQYQYDTKGNLIRKTEAAGLPEERITEYTYDAFGHRLTVKRLSDATTAEALTQYQYDNRGNLTQVTGTEGAITRYERDIQGNITKRTDARNNDWTRSYNTKGWLLTETDPLNRTISYTYSKLGQVTKITDARNKDRISEYDSDGRLTKITDAAGGATQWSFSQNELARITDPDGRITSFAYDAQRRFAETADGKANKTQFDYADPDTGDTTGFNPTRILYPTYEQRLKYDVRNRVTLDTTVLGQETRTRGYGYNARGDQTTVTDAAGHTVTQTYDAQGKLAKVTDRLGNTVEYSYDDRGNLISLKDPRNNLWRFEYDKANRVAKEINPLNQAIEYQYDANGNLTQSLNARGHKLVYTYDNGNQLTEIKAYNATDPQTPLLTQTQTFGYDANGNLTGWTDSTGSSGTLIYDDVNRLLSDTVTQGSVTLAYSYTYYPSGKVKTITYPGNFTLTYSYDAHGELQAVDVPGQGAITVNDWKWTVPTKTTLPGGTVREQGYDGLLDLTSLKVKSPGQQVLTNLTNTYGSRAELTARALDGQTESFSYDDEERLTQVQGPTTQTYTLDASGNRTAYSPVPGAWVYNAANQLLSQGSVTYEYDAAGNQTKKTDSALSEPQRTTHYVYDSFNRLIEVKDGNDATIATYTYDPSHRRLTKTVSGQTIYYLYSREGLLAEADSIGTPTTLYGWKPDNLFGTAPILIRQGSTVGYFHNDHLGTPIRVTDQSGAVIWSATYDAYGMATVAPGSTIQNNLRFPGQYYDAETGLHQNWHRYYDNAAGRYITRDPIGLEGGPNIYAYVRGSPTRLVDPTGLLQASFGGGVTVMGGVIGGSGTGGVVFDGINTCSYHQYCVLLGYGYAFGLGPNAGGSATNSALCSGTYSSVGAFYLEGIGPVGGGSATSGGDDLTLSVEGRGFGAALAGGVIWCVTVLSCAKECEQCEQ